MQQICWMPQTGLSAWAKMSDSPQRILIVRPSAIGDIVMASAMLKPLNRAWPDADIDWVVEPAYSPLLEANPLIEQVVLWDKLKWKELFRKFHLASALREIRGFAIPLRNANYDLVLDAQGLLRSRLLAWLSGGKKRIGFESKEPGRFLMTRIISRGPCSRMMSSEYHHMIRELGLETKDFKPFIVVGPEDNEWANQALQKKGIKDPYFAICPFTTRPQKHWFVQSWIKLAANLAQFYAVDIIVLGGPADRMTGEKIAEAAGKSIHNFAGKATLMQSAALLKRSALAIGVDTGLTHMATAFDVPTIALFGSTRPYLDAGKKSTCVVYSHFPCSPCKRRPTCDGRYDCMKWITPEMVMDEVKKLILQVPISGN